MFPTERYCCFPSQPYPQMEGGGWALWDAPLSPFRHGLGPVRPFYWRKFLNWVLFQPGVVQTLGLPPVRPSQRALMVEVASDMLARRLVGTMYCSAPTTGLLFPCGSGRGAPTPSCCRLGLTERGKKKDLVKTGQAVKGRGWSAHARHLLYLS